MILTLASWGIFPEEEPQGWTSDRGTELKQMRHSLRGCCCAFPRQLHCFQPKKVLLPRSPESTPSSASLFLAPEALALQVKTDKNQFQATRLSDSRVPGQVLLAKILASCSNQIEAGCRRQGGTLKNVTHLASYASSCLRPRCCEERSFASFF